MKPNLYLSLITAIILLTGFKAVAQTNDDPVADKIVAGLDKWLTSYQPEKVYLQTDKPYYAAGDDIWFKAYVTVGNDHRLSVLSNTLNVELINEKDSVIRWIKLPMKSGTTWADFALSDTLHGGNYRIRAYTNWMRNAGSDYYFDKPVTIGNAATNNVFTKTSYSYTTVNDKQKVSLTINYSDINGTPYTGKPVNYSIQFKDKDIAKDKGITDDKGNIVVDYFNPALALVNKGSITTGIKLAENSQVTKTIPLNSTLGKVDIQFFPESGSLVNGIASKVAFKAVGPNGLGVNLKGIVTDNENNKVSEFATQHLGMGAFTIKPENGKTYKALITYADGSTGTVNLPAALNSGYVLSIDNADPDEIGVKVTASADMVKAGQVYIFAQCGGETRYVVKSKAAESTFGATIAKSKFPSGIVQFTLFSATGEPLNERIAFIRREENLLSLNIKADKPTSSTSEKVTINLDAQNDADKPAIGSFSASVIDENKVKTDDDAATTILSHLLLTSDLRGYIEQPNYYFNHHNDTTDANLDILMLTQGYRRFEWKPLLAGTLAPPVYQPEKLIKISGSVKTLLGEKPVANAKVILFTLGAETPFVLDTVADKNGNFTFTPLFLKDSIRFIVQGRTPKDGKKIVITLDDNGGEDLDVKNKYLSAVDFNGRDDLTAYLKADKSLYAEELKYGLGNHTRVLQEVKIVAKPKTTIDFSNNINGPGKADQIITSAMLEQRGGCAFLNDCLQGLLVGVVFRNGQAYLTSNVSAGLTGPPRPMTIMLDGAQVNDFTNIPPEEVGTIEVLRGIQYTAIYGLRGNNGVLVITTKRGPDAVDYKRAPVGSAFSSPKGYYIVRTFYSPQYDDPKTDRSVAGLRSTIFWKPNIVTDKNGHASFDYYNAGSKGTYRITIEGIDADGNLGYKVYRYNVE